MRHALEQLEQRQVLAADLSVSMVENLPEFVVPGDRIVLAASISNEGDEPFAGPVTVHFNAPSIDYEDPMHEVAAVVKNLKLKPGATAVIAARIVVSDLPAAGVYDTGVTIETAPGADEYDGNNESWLDGAFDLKHVFGNYGSRRNIVMTTSDPSGAVVTFALRGPGYGEFIPSDSDGLTVLHFGDTSSASAFSMAVRGSPVDAALSIQVDGSLKLFDARAVNLSGEFNALGSLGGFVSRNLTDFDMGIGSAGPAMTFKAAEVTNLRLTTVAPIASLDVTNWLWLSDPDHPDIPQDQLSRLNAPWIGKLSSRGDFATIATLSGVGAPRLSLAGARIGGAFSGEIIALGNVGAFSAASIDQGLLLASGTVASFATVNAVEATLWAGAVTKVDIGSAQNIEVAAGAGFSSDDLAALSDGDASAISWGAGSIADLRVKGSVSRGRFAAGVNPVNGTLLDSDDITAGPGLIGKVTIGAADDVLFAATNLPLRAKIGASLIITADDDRFMLLNPVG